MAAYQLTLPGFYTVGETKTYGDIRRDFWRTWNGGNYARDARAINQLVSQLEKWIFTMVKQPEQKPESFPFHFVNVAVSDDDIDTIDELFPTADVAFGLLTGVLTEGFKVSFAVNSRNDMTICSLFDKREGSPTAGACLTGGGDGWYESLVVCLYKYTHLLQGDLGAAAADKGVKRRIQ